MQSSPPETISVATLTNLLLSSNKGAQPIAFTAVVDARAKKTLNPYGQILKLSRVQAFTGSDYENSVNRQRAREQNKETFCAESRKWGERISPYLVRDKGKYYLVAQVTKSCKPVYMVKTTTGPLVIISKEKIKDFLPVTQSGNNQGLGKEVVYRNYSLDSIKTLSIFGSKFRIR